MLDFFYFKSHSRKQLSKPSHMCSAHPDWLPRTRNVLRAFEWTIHNGVQRKSERATPRPLNGSAPRPTHYSRIHSGLTHAQDTFTGNLLTVGRALGSTQLQSHEHLTLLHKPRRRTLNKQKKQRVKKQKCSAVVWYLTRRRTWAGVGGKGGGGWTAWGRLGVKARVISERGAVFKFPDDGRRRYFSALGGWWALGEGEVGNRPSRSSSTVDSAEQRDCLVPRWGGGGGRGQGNRKSQAPPQPTASRLGGVR